MIKKTLIIFGIVLGLGTNNLFANTNANMNVNQNINKKVQTINFDKYDTKTLVELLKKSLPVEKLINILNKYSKNDDIKIQDIKIKEDGIYYIYKIKLSDTEFQRLKQYKDFIVENLKKEAKNIINRKNKNLIDTLITYLIKNRNYKIVYIYTNGKDKIEVPISYKDLIK